MHTYIQTHLGVFSMIDHLQITLPIKPFSPVSDVPSSGAGETPNDTPKQNPLSNGVPVSNDYDEMGF